jgi:hypothetical protein
LNAEAADAILDESGEYKTELGAYRYTLLIANPKIFEEVYRMGNKKAE